MVIERTWVLTVSLFGLILEDPSSPPADSVFLVNIFYYAYLTINLDPPLQNCIGQQSCSVTVAPEVFGGDPCPGNMKKLSIEAVCS